MNEHRMTEDYPFYSAVFSQGRAALDNAAAPFSTASYFSTTATLPRESQDRIFGHCRLSEQLGIESAIGAWFFRDCGVDVTDEDIDERVNAFDEKFVLTMIPKGTLDKTAAPSVPDCEDGR